jgi:hypothetical protein
LHVLSINPGRMELAAEELLIPLQTVAVTDTAGSAGDREARRLAWGGGGLEGRLTLSVG